MRLWPPSFFFTIAKLICMGDIKTGCIKNYVLKFGPRSRHSNLDFLNRINMVVIPSLKIASALF
jgi:hypothetical protein